MTTDNLTVFGTDYTGVTGIKAKGTGNGMLTYIRPTGTKSISENGTGIDVAAYSLVDVAVSGGGGDSYIRTIVVPEQTAVAGYGSDDQAILTAVAGLEENEVYIITYDGTEYASSCTLMWYQDYTIGEVVHFFQGPTENNFPFGVIWEQGVMYLATNEKKSHTIKVEHLEFIDGPLNLISKSIASNGTYNASSDNADGYSSVTVNVSGGGGTYQAKTNISPTTSSQTITPDSGYDALSSVQINAMPTGTAGTPSATKGTVSNHSVSVTPSVTNTTGYITGGTKTGTALSVSASELVSGTYTVGASGTHDVTNYASASVASGGATASATKGTVSNHSVTVTPSVTRTAGYVTAGSSNGTAVTVSASELVSGSQTITTNGTVDVTNLASVVVEVQGSGSSGVSEAGAYTELQSRSSTITFTGLEGEPTSFTVMYDDSVSVPSGTPYNVVSVVYDGTSVHAQTLTNTSNAQVTYDASSFAKSYSNGTLTITSTGAQFIDGIWFISYTYGGGAIDTKDVQVSSGATSITFTGLEDEPLYWSLIFKSNFSTSSGYQRVIVLRKNSSNIYGFAMDSRANGTSLYWTESYSNGSLTITSQGTNAGGYFHQPGYYQLTYAYDATGNYQSKTVTPSTSQQVITADAQYDALKQVTVNAIPSQYIVPSGNKAISENGNNIDVTDYATVSVNVPSGSSMNVQTAQSTTRVANTAYTKTASLTCAVSGTYDVYWDCFRSSTSGTNGSQLYIGGTASGSANTTFSNHAQNNHLTGVQINANQEVAVYVRSRATNYYAYCGQLTIVQTA